MLNKLDEKLKLREHYSASYDVFSRLWADDVSPEWVQRHYRSRVSANYDDYSGALVIRAPSAPGVGPRRGGVIALGAHGEGEGAAGVLARP